MSEDSGGDSANRKARAEQLRAAIDEVRRRSRRPAPRGDGPDQVPPAGESLREAVHRRMRELDDTDKDGGDDPGAAPRGTRDPK